MDPVTSIDVNASGSSPEEQGNQIILPDYIRAYVQRSMEKETSAVVADQNKSDWQAVARVIDRLFLVIFFAVMMNQYFGIYDYNG